MQPSPTSPSLASAPALPALAANTCAPTRGEVGTLLARLLQDEARLHALTRDRRHDATVRKFSRLHALLNDQFTEIGTRVVKLATRSRALGVRVSMRHRTLTASDTSRADTALRAHVIGELLDRHVALLHRLRPEKAPSGDDLQDSITTELLADLIAEHEKDASMLRALLWEVQHAGP